MIMEVCGLGMTAVTWVASLLGLGLLATLIVLLWVVVGRLRQNPTLPTGEEGMGRQ